MVKFSVVGVAEFRYVVSKYCTVRLGSSIGSQLSICKTVSFPDQSSSLPIVTVMPPGFKVRSTATARPLNGMEEVEAVVDKNAETAKSGINAEAAAEIKPNYPCFPHMTSDCSHRQTIN